MASIAPFFVFEPKQNGSWFEFKHLPAPGYGHGLHHLFGDHANCGTAGRDWSSIRMLA